MDTGVDILQQEVGDVVEEGHRLMRGRYSSLEGVYVGGCPLDHSLQLTNVGTHISEEACDNVSECPQLSAQIV